MRLDRRRFLLGAAGATGLALLAAACGAPASPTAAPKAAEPTKPAAAAPTTAPAAAPTTAPAAKPAEPTKPAAAAPTTAPAAAATKPAAAPAAGAQKVIFWGAWGGNLGKSVDELVERYNKLGGPITAEHQFQGTYEETANKLTAALAAKQVPDVAALSDVWWFSFYLNSSLAPLDDLMASAKVDKTDYVDSLINEGVKEGKTWWIPFARSTPLFYYNKDMFKAAGLPDRAPKNWTEFLEWAPKLAKPDANLSAIAFAGSASYIAWVFQGMIWQWGGKYSTEITDPNFKILLAEPPGVEAGQFVHDLIHKYRFAVATKDSQVDFINQLAATAMLSTGSLAGVTTGATGKFQFGTGFLPEMKQFGCPTGGAGLGIMAAITPDRQAAAMDFVKFASSPDQQVIWSQSTGYMPVRKSSVNSPDMKAFFEKNPNAKVAVDQLAKTSPQDAARVFIRNGDQMIGKGLEKITLEKQDPKTAFTAAAEELMREASKPGGVLQLVKAKKP
ncbi:MAG: ABC transporter substrate-binding protein [Chloroflexi bacterium]|nr:ABC transporter substrate-binding protein [Chloroflexota bacterium]